MKKLLTYSLILFLSANLFAQTDTDEKKFHLGLLFVPKLNWAAAESKNIDSDGAKAGLAMGLSVDYHFAKNYSFAVELLHFGGGYKIKADSISYRNSGTNTTIKSGNVGINYTERAFQLPITIKLRTGEIGYWKYFGQIGIAPIVSYRKIKADFDVPTMFGANPEDAQDRFVNDSKNDYDYSSIPETYRSSFLEEDNVSGIRIPLLVSAGAEWNLSGATSIIMGIRYEYGIVNVTKAENTIARISSFGLLAGIRF